MSAAIKGVGVPSNPELSPGVLAGKDGRRDGPKRRTEKTAGKNSNFAEFQFFLIFTGRKPNCRIKKTLISSKSHLLGLAHRS